MPRTVPTQPPTLPPVTEAHRRAAFVAMGWVGWTYEQALADPVRSRVVECRAHALRKAQWQQERRQARQSRWVRQPWPSTGMAGRDGKRASAGDFDD